MSRVLTIGKRLRRARRRAGLSLTDVVELGARAAGVNIDLSALDALERGDGPAPESAVLAALSRVLDLDESELTAGAKYVSSASQAVLRVVDELARTPLDPQPLAALVERLAEPRDRIYRALVNLDEYGWVEQTPGGAWRLTPDLGRISERVRLALHDAHRRYLT